MALYVQYGCGFTAPEGWLNFDASPTLRFERIPVLGSLYTKNAQRFPASAKYGDVTRGLPVEANSADGVFCSHILEHLALRDCEKALRNTYSYLKPGGLFRLVVPDMEQLAREYVQSGDVHTFMRESGLGLEARHRIRDVLGNTGHLWMWDEKAMRTQLEATGFRDIRRAQYGDSSDPRFIECEKIYRFEGCLGMECRK